MKLKPDNLRNLLLTGALILSVAPAFAEATNDFDYLQNDLALISMVSFLILLLAGILLRMRRMRLELDVKTVALNKSERHVRQMGDSLPNLTILQLTLSEEGEFRFTYLSKGFERALGFKTQLVLADAHLLYQHIYEDDLPNLLDTFFESRSQLTPVELELRLVDAHGDLKWLYLSAAPHREGSDLIWDGFMRDISVTKEIEDTLIEENQNFQNLFETIDDFLLICDTDGRLIHVNPSVVNRLEYSMDELYSMNIFELYAKESQQKMAQLVSQMRSEKSMTTGLPLKMQSGNTIPVEMNVFQGTWKNEHAIFCVARDITLRQQTESALRESQNMLQLIMDTIPMAVFWKDKDSVYLGCNKTFIRECGFESIDHVVGKTPFDLFEPNFAPDVVDRDQEVIANNQPFFNFLQSHTRADGTTGWREISKIPLRNETGRAVGVLGVWRDVTEQNHAEERLKRTLEDMERFNQLMRGRERRTLELKAEINALLKELGRPRKYRTTTEHIR